MPFHGQMGLVHRAVLWRRVGTESGARPVVSTVAVGIDCRWDDRRRTVAGADGQPIATDATVTVDREIPVGSKMVKGDPSDLPGTGQTPDREVFEVVTYEADDDWRGAETWREVTLIRAGDSLGPTAVEPEG